MTLRVGRYVFLSVVAAVSILLAWTGHRPSMAFLTIAPAVTLGLKWLQRSYHRAFGEVASSIMGTAFHANRPNPMRVTRSWSAAGDGIVLGVWTSLGWLVTWARPGPTLQGAVLTWTLGVAAAMAAFMLASIVTWNRPGRSLFDLTETGVRIRSGRIAVSWTEIDHVYCMSTNDHHPGLALHVADVVVADGRLGRRRTAALSRNGGWLFVAEDDMGANLADVMVAAVGLHRAATE
jgi:hypothetical protein